MLRSLATVSGFTLLSRILGLVRDVLMAGFFGTHAQSDAFVAAFRFPNMFRRIFGEGAFNAAYVPLLSKELETGSKEEAQAFASTAFSWLAWVLIIGTLLILPAMRWVMAIFAFGFLQPEGWVFSWTWFWEMARYPQGTETFELTVHLAQIMFSYLLCMALGAHLSGTLNTLKIFGMPAFAPVLLNIIWITGLAVVIPVGGFAADLNQIAQVASWCVFVAGWAQLLALWLTLRKKGWNVSLNFPKRSSKMKKLGMLMIPGVLAASIQQINLLIGTQIATTHEGSTSIIHYTDRIFQFPLGMIGIAFGVVLLPEVSRLLRKGDTEGVRESIKNGILFSMLLTIPATAAMFVIPEEIFGAIFERKNWEAKDTVEASKTLICFAIGLPAYILIKVLQPAYFANENTKTPMKIGAVTVLVNIIFSLILFPTMKHVGIALATSIAGIVSLFLYWRGTRQIVQLDRDAIQKLLRMIVASLVMGVVLWGAKVALEGFYDSGQLGRVITAACLVSVGAASYFCAAIAIRATSMAELKGGFRRS